jgi:hypothetical protein
MALNSGKGMFSLPAQKPARKFYALSRLNVDAVWEESIQYDSFGRGKILEHIRAISPGRLRSETPEAGWIDLTGNICGGQRNGARPVWIWGTE